MRLSSNMERPMIHPLRLSLDSFANKKTQIVMSILFLLGSFFLSQAVLFEAAVPFFLPIWALARTRFRNHLIWVFIGGMAGSAFLGLGQAVIHLLQLFLFNIVTRYAWARKFMHLTVASSVLIIQVGWQLLMHGGHIPIDTQLFIGFEVILAAFMTFFLFIAFPTEERLFFGKWTVEQLGAACFIGAMTLTGIKGIVIGYISISSVFIHFIILMAAAIGGLSFSTTIAMIIATIIGISELAFTGMMAVYGMTGFFAGVLSRYGKIGIATGGLFVSGFFFMYDLTLPLDVVHFASISFATLLFLFVPARNIQSYEEKLFPQHKEQAKKRQEWLTTRLNEQLNDFQQFTEFMSSIVSGRSIERNETASTISHSTPTVCQSCFRYTKCWEDEDSDMNHLINEWEATYSMTKKTAQHRVEEKMKYKCIRFTGLIQEIEEYATNRMLSGQLQHGRKMLALQLRDMSTHLDQVMQDIKNDLSIYKTAEEELARQLEKQGIEYFQIDILSERRGGKQVVFCLPEKRADFETDTTVAERCVLPVLEDLYDEPFEIVKSVVKEEPFTHVQVTFGSSIRFSFDYGLTATAAQGSFHPGDAYEVFPIHDGLTAILLSDGMGQDLKAYRESRKVIRLMRECLDRKVAPETAMHTLHYLMSLNGLDDMYATLDLALVDLQEGRLWSWKAGAMSTYIKRGEEFIRLDSQSVPVGFLPSFSIEAKSKELKAGDILVMMTDGMFNGDVDLEIQEKVLYETIDRYEYLDCDSLSNQLVKEMEQRFEAVDDDRTVLVMKIDHILSRWSGFTPSSQEPRKVGR